MTRDRTNLIIKACYMYYMENLTQAQIAKQLGVSRPQISRFLTYARENNIVSITINDPQSGRSVIEEKMCRIFHLKECHIVDKIASDRHDTMFLMDEESNDLIRRNLNDGDIVGISAGKTLYHASLALTDPQKKNLKVVPICGGTGYKGERWQTNKIISNISERWECESFQLNSPTFVSSESLKNQLIQEPDIKDILSLAKKSNLVIAGIGILDNIGTLMETGFLNEADIRELKEKKAVSSICGSFLDENGNDINFSGYKRMIGYRIDQFGQGTKVIAYAFGDEKIKSILAALKTGKIYALVTDILTAQSILDKYS